MNARKQPQRSSSRQTSKVDKQGDFHSGISFGEKTHLLIGDRGSEVDIIVPSDRKEDGGKKKKKKPSLFKVLAKTCGPSLLMCWPLKLMADILTFIGPTLQRWVSKYSAQKVDALPQLMNNKL